MIEIIIQSQDDIIQAIEIKGHANSAPYGEDLVCAAVSAIITGGANALHEVNQFIIKLDEGHALIKAKDNISKADEIVLETIVKQLQTIEESYPKFIRIK